MVFMKQVLSWTLRVKFLLRKLGGLGGDLLILVEGIVIFLVLFLNEEFVGIFQDSQLGAWGADLFIISEGYRLEELHDFI